MVSGESSVQRHAVDLTLTETPGRQAPVRQHQRPATARPSWGMTESRRPLTEPPVLPVDPDVQDVFARTPGRRTRPPTARPPVGRRHNQRRLRARPAARDRNRGVAAHDVRPVGPGYRLPRRLHPLSSVVTTTDRLAGHGAVGIAAWYLGLSTVAGLAAASLGQVTGASRGDVPGSSPPTVRFDPADPATELAEGRWR